MDVIALSVCIEPLRLHGLLQKWLTVATAVLHALTFLLFPKCQFKDIMNLLMQKQCTDSLFNVTLQRLALGDIDNQNNSSGSQMCKTKQMVV